ncbi:MAG: HDIG domain-containing protein [Candidatus Hydrogenedentes bacterium]|nr:HDIG domain-containing protein [Candidatus Hydrogenedentota bacterium]
MIFSKPGRKNGRPGTILSKPHAESQTPPVFNTRSDWLALALVVLVFAAAITRPPDFSRLGLGGSGLADTPRANLQSVAREEVRAEITFETEDLQATKAKRDEAAAKVPDTYRVDRERVRAQLQLLNEQVQLLAGRRDEVAELVAGALRKGPAAESDEAIVAKVVEDYAGKLKEDPAFKSMPDASILAVWLTPSPDSIPRRVIKNNSVTDLAEPELSPLKFAFANDLGRISREGLEYVLTYGVVRPETAVENARRRIAIVRANPVGDQTASEEKPMSEVPTTEGAEDLLNERIIEAARMVAATNPDIPVDWAKLQTAAFALARPYLTDTLSYDEVSTVGAQEQARLAVAPVLIQKQLGEVLQRSGERWTAQSWSDVMTYRAKMEEQREPGWRQLSAFFAHVILVTLIVFYLLRVASLLTPKREEIRRNVYLAFLLMGSVLVAGRVVSYFEPTGFVLPVAAVGVLVAILVNARFAVMVGLMAAVLVSVQFGYGWRLLFVTSAMSVAGILGMYRVRRRGDITRAALKATVVGLVAMLAVTLATDSLTSELALRRLLLVLLNGSICMFLIPGVLSPLERLFKITTDIQLLEYSDLNNEVLGRMAIEMPATYAHSLMLGQLAEAAAESVGANGLLARVCAYYHDIGKIRRPEYFSENQTGRNIHDQLPPRLSARAIASHVGCGVDLAREYHLPNPIVDGIREHHGTNLISFFYQQAIEQKKHDDVRLDDFRYPGPKPQSRETAILMICDAVESGVRSIKNLNEDRVRDFIDKIITSRSADRQFDECDLTLKDLDTIKDAITRRMVTALHTRISYPERKPDQPTVNVVPMSGGGA